MKNYLLQFLLSYKTLIKILITCTLTLTVFINIKFKQQLVIEQQLDQEEHDSIRQYKPDFYVIPPKIDENLVKSASILDADLFNSSQLLLKNTISSVNSYSIVHNKHFLLNENGMINSNLTVLLVQVNKRVKYLSVLIDSLSNVDAINRTLLIFSHDFYDQQLNEVINKIKFCSYMQIFYPFTTQLYESRFPGLDKNDCLPTNLTKQQALLKQCNNAEHPDTYGNYRNYQIVQIKHHWWWKVSYVFDTLVHTRDLDNLGVLLLEEDYYLMPDALYMLDKLREKVQNDMQIISLGYFEKRKQITDLTSGSHKYGEGPFHSGSHNTGMYLTRSIWRKIKECSSEFCTYDDYNWDWTVQFIGQKCIKPSFKSIFSYVSRVIHMGECGTHHKGSNCDPNVKVNELQKRNENNKSLFFPKKIDLSISASHVYILKKPNGGWGDIRDHMLCKSFINFNKTAVI